MSAVPCWAAGIGIGLQIAYPLTSGPALDAITLLSILAFLIAVTTALVQACGLRAGGGCVLLILLAGWGIEAAGVHTGWPFGRYEYTSDLGGTIASVPLVVPAAWAAMAPIGLLVGRKLGANRLHTALIGAAFLTSWDVFLDPQMVADGRWHWIDPGTAFPGVPGIPLSNFAGWLIVSVLIVAAIDRILPPVHAPVADAILYWTYFSQLLGALVFFGRPSVALVGGIAMGAVVLPYLRRAIR
ncbi:MAG TPA: carotenoid biosynthesis protein [Mycobacteriales bacterium]|nr:carotenoid biosynthesis protein [Mycobacteriales bacterium]